MALGLAMALRLMHLCLCEKTQSPASEEEEHFFFVFFECFECFGWICLLENLKTPEKQDKSDKASKTKERPRQCQQVFFAFFPSLRVQVPPEKGFNPLKPPQNTFLEGVEGPLGLPT